MPTELYPWMHLIGRVLFAMLFFGSGLNHLMQLQNMTAYAQSKRVPAPKAAVLVSGFMILVGAVLVGFGWHRFIGAWLLVIFLLAAAFLVHAYWRETDPQMRANERAHFMKNLALAGAALIIAFYAGMPWPFAAGAP